ncbi:MAG: hypothetical protein KAG53_08940 [Endozoicomonadaceae bacterium]|nr:hypothetical protein [Endozoicomonadaceae bacterium]
MNSIQNNNSACSMISNTNRACYELSNDTSARWASLGISRLSKIILQEAILCLSGDGYFASEYNDIHCVRCHRTVSLNEAKAYLDDSNSMSCPCFKDIIDVRNNSEDTKKISIKRQLYGFLPAYFSTMLAPLMEDPLTGVDCNPSLIDICSVLVNIYYPPASYLISAIQVGTVFYALANIPSCGANAIANVIEIDDFNIFQKIGRDKDYPSNGHYIITKDLVGNSRHTYPIIENFSGSLDGQGHSISKHSGCLIGHFRGYGIIGNIIFNESSSIDASCRPLVAMLASDHSLLTHVRVKGYELHSQQDDIKVAIMVGKLINWARIESCSVVDASVTFQGKHPAFAFLVLDMTDDSSVDNNTIINARVNMDTSVRLYEKSKSSCGSIGSMSDRSCCNNTTVINCVIKASNPHVLCTFGGVWLLDTAQVNNLLAIRCNIEMTGIVPVIGMGASFLGVGTLSNSNMAIDCNLKTVNFGAHFGIGAGRAHGAQSDNNVAAGCHIKLERAHSKTAVGIGFIYKKHSRVSVSRNNIVVSTRVEISGNSSEAHISIGNMPEHNSTDNTIINYTLTTLERVYKIPFSGSPNRSTICQDLPYYRTGFLNNNCTLNQSVVDSYVNKITTWDTTVLNTGRVIGGKLDPVIENIVTSNKFNEGLMATIISGFIGVMLIGSYYRGYRKGNRGRALIIYPLTACQHCIRGMTTAERENNTAVVYSSGSTISFFGNESDPNANYSDSFILPDYNESDPNPGYSDSGIPPIYSELDPMRSDLEELPPSYCDS